MKTICLRSYLVVFWRFKVEIKGRDSRTVRNPARRVQTRDGVHTNLAPIITCTATETSYATASSELKNMALPQSLMVSVMPSELELICSEQLVEIIPLVAMERTAFISVMCTFLHMHS